MRKELLLVALPALMCCSGDVEYPPIEPQLMEALESHVKSKAQRPEDLIVGGFKIGNVVFLGETHRIRQNAQFVQRMIPVLYENGIYNLCTEYAKREDQPLIDSLITGDGWDEGLAREIAFRFSPMWGYREYIDVFKAAWMLNSGLSAGERRFRIFGLNDSPDLCPAGGNNNDGGGFLARVTSGGGEETWFRVLSSIIRVEGERAVVYCSVYQALTEYKYALRDSKGLRIKTGPPTLGNIAESLKMDPFTVLLHGPWDPAEGCGEREVYAADGLMDALISRLPEGSLPFGVETRDTPFGALTGKTCIYKIGHPYFTLRDLCRGYICLSPLCELQGPTPVEGFINESNIERARDKVSDPGLRKASPAEFGEALRRGAEFSFPHLGCSDPKSP